MQNVCRFAWSSAHSAALRFVFDNSLYQLYTRHSEAGPGRWLEPDPRQGQAGHGCFSRDDFNKLVDSTDVYQQKSREAAADPVGTCLRALLVLMRGSELAIRDAVTLERERLNTKAWSVFLAFPVI